MPSESVCYPAKLVHGHIMNLLEKGAKTIFYPCIMYENQEFSNADNHFNCPIVQSFSEAIKLNVEDIKYIKEYKFTKKLLKESIHLSIQQQKRFKKEVRSRGKEFLDYINTHNEKAIVLAGRPYHLDKEVNHGIDTLINSLGIEVLTEDSICHLSKIKSKFQDQWSYLSRVDHAGDVVAHYPNIELINLNSFGCGLDAIVTDQVEEILKYNNRLFTTIKIDKINNLRAIK